MAQAEPEHYSSGSKSSKGIGVAALTQKSIALALVSAVIATAAVAGPAPQRAPFTETLSNTTPLVFGMTITEAANALGVPLHHVRGSPGNELFAAARPSPGYMKRQARLFLQFRHGRLSGWKGDWASNWMWE